MSDSDLDVLAPPSQELTLAGKRLTITPLVVGELPAMLRAVAPFAREFAGEPGWIALLGEHGEAVLAALALGRPSPTCRTTKRSSPCFCACPARRSATTSASGH